MAAFLEAIQRRIGPRFRLASCKEQGCKASLEGIPKERVLIDGDAALPAHGFDGRSCDCLLFYTCSERNKTVVVLIELKSGGIRVSNVVEKLTLGAKFVERILRRNKVECYPVLIHGKRLHKNQFEQLNQQKIGFKGNELAIRTARCKEPGNIAACLN